MIIYEEIIASKLNLGLVQVKNTLELINEGATIPFISRYRKERTGSMDELQLAGVRDTYEQLKELEKRQQYILKTIDTQGNLTDELRKQIEDTLDPKALEDIYLPYKPKKKTRASVARGKGLEPLAKVIMKQQEMSLDQRASEFISDEVPTVEEALEGARDIIAEWINENQRARNIVRQHFTREAVIYSKVAKGKEEEGSKYRDYFNYHEPLRKCPSHRILAIRRGETEGFLKVTIEPVASKVLDDLFHFFLKGNNDVSIQVELAVRDAYKRLLAPSIENEFKSDSKEKADEEAIRVFAENLRQLLLASPLGEKRILAIDPGYRTGCKVVCLNAQGNLLHNAAVYPHPPQSDRSGASKKISALLQQYKIQAIAIGNGTASRETERFIRLVRMPEDVQVYVVNEAGASIYSASKVAREEFPDYDVTVRGAVSIGRRLMDPLAELVKIEPRSIGVGQYQHDVDQGMLKKGLDEVVESCVNMVGVDVNTASHHLLNYVSGLGPVLSKNIINFRKENGPFASRESLRSVPRMGDKAFEQCAGFLRIRNAIHPLDNSAVHPESYFVVERMAGDLGCDLDELIKSESMIDSLDINTYVSGNIGIPTLKDIVAELKKPGRDPREDIQVFEFSKDVMNVSDLNPGMELPGLVTNITNFGAFVDVGVKQDGLVHISQLADRFVKDPNDVVKINQKVRVKVLDVDEKRNRISLAMKGVRQFGS
ncbi:MAG: RNA-binding transcriptional accessory protein [Bacteroidales bacterium]|nr:RNA-binding transcriptional accessory protein [Bacteroidales bacterium]